MTILALDLATVTGWAVAPQPYQPAPPPLERAAGLAPPARKSGIKSFRPWSFKLGLVFQKFDNWLPDLIWIHKPTLIVFEAPFVGGVRNANVARMLFGFCALTEMVAAREGIPVLECSNATIKKHATGSGNANKRAMVQAARAAGWSPTDDNEADALWLVDYAAALKK